MDRPGGGNQARVNWFGPDWGAPVNQNTEPIEIPIGVPCTRCFRPFTDGDRGVTVPSLSGDLSFVTLASFHLDCMLKEVGVGHHLQERTSTLEVKRYIKRPVTVEAVQLPSQTENMKPSPEMDEIADWCNGTVTWSRSRPIGILLPTLEGAMTASLGDYIVKGVEGEFYPIKGKIFEKTYEAGE